MILWWAAFAAEAAPPSASPPAPPPPLCAEPAAPPAGLEAWGRPVPATRSIMAGTAADLMLADVVDLRWATPPARAPIGGTYGAVLSVTIWRAGQYRLALSARASVALVKDGRPVAAGAVSGGPPCSGIRQIVDYRLKPGQYALQLSGAAGPEMTLLLVAP